MTRDGTDMAAREVYPETMRPHVPSPGRTGTGGSVTPPFGVLCGGETTYVWSFLSGGVLWSIACDGWVTTHYAFHPFTATDGAPVASDGSGPLRRGEPWEASWPEGQWENVRAVDACESSSGMHPDTYRTDLIHGGRMHPRRAFAGVYGPHVLPLAFGPRRLPRLAPA